VTRSVANHMAVNRCRVDGICLAIVRFDDQVQANRGRQSDKSREIAGS